LFFADQDQIRLTISIGLAIIVVSIIIVYNFINDFVTRFSHFFLVYIIVISKLRTSC